jgi:hypothetical protein
VRRSIEWFEKVSLTLNPIHKLKQQKSKHFMKRFFSLIFVSFIFHFHLQLHIFELILFEVFFCSILMCWLFFSSSPSFAGVKLSCKKNEMKWNEIDVLLLKTCLFYFSNTRIVFQFFVSFTLYSNLSSPLLCASIIVMIIRDIFFPHSTDRSHTLNWIINSLLSLKFFKFVFSSLHSTLTLYKQNPTINRNDKCKPDILRFAIISRVSITFAFFPKNSLLTYKDE